MKIDFPKLMSKKSDEGLQEYLDNRDRYVPDAIEAAVVEMKKRGRKFTVEEIEGLIREMRERREADERELMEFDELMRSGSGDGDGGGWGGDGGDGGDGGGDGGE